MPAACNVYVLCIMQKNVVSNVVTFRSQLIFLLITQDLFFFFIWNLLYWAPKTRKRKKNGRLGGWRWEERREEGRKEVSVRHFLVFLTLFLRASFRCLFCPCKIQTLNKLLDSSLSLYQFWLFIVAQQNPSENWVGKKSITSVHFTPEGKVKSPK